MRRHPGATDAVPALGGLKTAIQDFFRRGLETGFPFF
jgi:hypothetical protein